MSATAVAVKKDRTQWVDAAKGISIVLVVLVHSTTWLEFAGVESHLLKQFDQAFAMLRMPLFFCMSGLFAAKWVGKPWRELWSGKLSLLLWVFVIWQPVVFVYKILGAATLPGQEDRSLVAHLARFVLSPVRPSGELWFLWALAMFFVVAKLLSRLPVWLHLTLAGVVSAAWWGVAEPLLSDGALRLLSNGWRGAATYYFFFAVGIYGRQVILRFSEVNKLILGGIFVAWIGVEWFAISTKIVNAVPVTYFMLKVIGLIAGIALAVLIAKLPGLSWMGARTLQIYVAHTFFIVLIAVGVHAAGVEIVNSPAAFVIPILVTAIAVTCTLILHRLISGRGLTRYLYVQPAWVANLSAAPAKRRSTFGAATP